MSSCNCNFSSMLTSHCCLSVRGTRFPLELVELFNSAILVLIISFIYSGNGPESTHDEADEDDTDDNDEADPDEEDDLLDAEGEEDDGGPPIDEDADDEDPDEEDDLLDTEAEEGGGPLNEEADDEDPDEEDDLLDTEGEEGGDGTACRKFIKVFISALAIASLGGSICTTSSYPALC